MSKSIQESESVMDDLQQVLQSTGLHYVDGLYDWQTLLWIRKNKEQESISNRTTKGVSLRSYGKSGWAYSCSNEVEKSAIRKLTSTLRKDSAGGGANRLTVPDPLEMNVEMPVKKNPLDVPVDEKLQKVREVFELTRQLDPRIADTRVAYAESIIDRVLVSSNGTKARQVIPRTRFLVEVVVKENGTTDSDNLNLGGTIGYEVAEDVTEDRLRGVVKSAVEQLKAISPPTGVQTVILDPGVVGTVCHESFGHGLEADQAVRGRSYLRDLLGKKVASDLVTMYEDSSLERANGTYFFDDDGVKARKNTLVQDGILVSFLHDVETGAAMKAHLTGSSRTQNAARRRFIRMSNTYAKPGDRSLDDIVRDTKNGIMVMRWQFGIEDPLGGGMQVSTKKGYLIENGNKTKPLKSITLTGRVLDVLGNVDAISSDGFSVDPGNCGKGTEDYVPVGSGGTWWRTKAVIA